MTEIHVKVSGASAVARKTGPLVAGTVGMPAHFSFDNKWAGLNVIAVFEGSGVSKSVPLLDETSVTVPWECLMKAKTSLRIGLEGRLSDGSIVIPTVWANVGYIEPGAKATDDLAQEPSPTPFDILMAAVAKCVKSVNGVAPDENGNVKIEAGGGVSDSEKSLILSLFRNAAYTADMSATFAQLAELWGIEVPDDPVVPDEPDVPDEPEEPDVPVVTLTSISATYSGGDVPVGTAVTDLTSIVVTAHYSDGTSKAVTDYTLSGTIAEGANTITVSYGGKTTTFAVTGVAEEDPSAISVRYEMPTETTFDGTNYIDTGVMLTEEDRDYTICLDYTPTAKKGRPFDISNNGTGGVRLGLRGGYFWEMYTYASTCASISTAIENMKIVLTHKKDSDLADVYWVTASNAEKQTATDLKYLYASDAIKYSKNIILGADYTKAANFAQGTMHHFVVYNGVLDETAINEFLAHTGGGDSGGDSGGNASTEPVYQLAQATAFDGATSVDTGYILNDVDKDFSICVEYLPTNNGMLFDASKNANLFGPSMALQGEYFKVGSRTQIAQACQKVDTKFIVTHENGSGVFKVYIINEKVGTTFAEYELTYDQYATNQHSIGNTNTLKIGSKYTGDADYLTGTVNRFEIYERVLSENEINDFMGVSA